MKTKIGIISLGCPRTLVDSEVMLGHLARAGYGMAKRTEDSDVLVINTCSFIEDAKRESIDTILQAIEMKKEGKVQAVVVAGCLAQRYQKELLDQLPEVDYFLGTGDCEEIVTAVGKSLRGKRGAAVGIPNYLYNHITPRLLLTPSHYAYVKISEGCEHRCTFCVIPQMKGPHRSREIQSVVEEVKQLTQSGIKEINLVSQDSSSYGRDRYGEVRLPALLRRLCQETPVQWLRLLYTYPSNISDELLSVMANYPQICKYMDLPLQHINERILKSMARDQVTRRGIEALLKKIRKQVPGIAIRTAFIVGYPGETEEEFKELLDFIRETQFDRMGAFIYSQEEGSRAAKFPVQIPDGVKKERLQRLMSLQQEVALQVNARLLHQTVTVFIEEPLQGEEGIYLGRTHADAPEVDGQVYVKTGRRWKVEVGDFVKVQIADTLEYDLVGEVCE
jgi:ribosomal protein S12 methylthiotransferase